MVKKRTIYYHSRKYYMITVAKNAPRKHSKTASKTAEFHSGAAMTRSMSHDDADKYFSDQTISQTSSCLRYPHPVCRSAEDGYMKLCSTKRSGEHFQCLQDFFRLSGLVVIQPTYAASIRRAYMPAPCPAEQGRGSFGECSREPVRREEVNDIQSAVCRLVCCCCIQRNPSGLLATTDHSHGWSKGT
jgi:hypothetical protein